MKIIYFISFCLCIGNICHSQILKKVANDVKNQVEWKVRSKATQKTDQAIDSVLAPRQKTENNKSRNDKNPPISTSGKSTTASSAEENSGEGFVTLSTSAEEIFKGGIVVITGSSVKFENFNEVKMIVSGNGDSKTETLKLYENNSFAAGWQAEQAGDYTITVYSSDGKAKTFKKVKVYDIQLMDDWTGNNIEETERAENKLDKEAARLKQSIGQKDKQQLDVKIAETKKKIEKVSKLFKDLNIAGRQLGDLTKSGTAISQNLAANLSQLNDHLAAQRTEMKKVNDAVNHEPYDNTVCEYLVMVNEACAAFSTFTNLWAKSATAILKNIALDKAVPKQVEIINQNTVQVGAGTEFVGKEAGKIFATALDDAEQLETGMGKAGIAGDVAQFVSEALMKSYCGIIKGNINHDYEITYRNKAAAPWWSYSYTTASSITLRYPKNSSGSIIKMKGNIEGNATSFKFFENVEIEDEFREKMKGRARLVHIPVMKPMAVPFSTSQKDALGFGAVARGLATPSYFNIPVDAEYNVDEGTIKLYLNEPLIDFSPLVTYRYWYFANAVLPLYAVVDFPINKVKLTMNAVVSHANNNELKVIKVAGGGLAIKGAGTRAIGSATSETEHKINYSLAAKNEN